MDSFVKELMEQAANIDLELQFWRDMSPDDVDSLLEQRFEIAQMLARVFQIVVARS